MLRGVLSGRGRHDQDAGPVEIPDPLARNRRERRLAWLLLILLAGVVWAGGWIAKPTEAPHESSAVERAP